MVNNRAHFCDTHKSLAQQCVVTDCEKESEEGFQTCADPSHRDLEHARSARGKGFFQLRKRLERHQVAYLADSVSPPAEDIPDDPEVVDPSHKSDEGNQKPKARFGRRRTHNEQLVVACCGVITGRATMYGAEAVPGVKVSISGII